MKEGRARKRYLFIKANVPIVCQADRQPWGVQLEREMGVVGASCQGRWRKIRNPEAGVVRG